MYNLSYMLIEALSSEAKFNPSIFFDFFICKLVSSFCARALDNKNGFAAARWFGIYLEYCADVFSGLTVSRVIYPLDLGKSRFFNQWVFLFLIRSFIFLDALGYII